MTQRNYEDPNYKKWRKEVYRRDGFKCRWPNCKARRGLNAHHIKTWAHYPGLRFDPNNGITLADDTINKSKVWKTPMKLYFSKY